MRKTIAAAMALMLWSVGAGAERLADILQTIRANNTGLKAMLKDIEADNADTRADNTVGGPSVEYSPFWQKNVDGVASSELVVSQEFDFPTLYSARGKSADLKDKALMLQYDAARRNLLLQAKGLCIDLVKLRKERELLDLRRGYADTMLRLIEKKERAGASTALEVNKTRMEKMSLDAAAQSNDAGQLAIEEQLTALNASLPLELDGLDYPATDPISDYQSFKELALSSDPAILAARGEVVAARQELKVSRSEWLPSLTMGYRRNTAPGESANGFVVGLSFPVWSTSQRTRAARARQTAAELRADDESRRLESSLEAQYRELVILEKTIAAYDPELMTRTLALLAKAVDAGQITVLDYFTEADIVYGKMQELIDARYNYQSVMASLTRSTL